MHLSERRLPVPLLRRSRRRRIGIRVASRTAWLAGLLWATTVVVSALTPVLSDSIGNVLNGLILVAFVTVGAVIAYHRPTNPIGWIFVLGTLLWALGAFGVDYAARALPPRSHPLPGALAAAVFGTWARALGWTLMVTFVPLLFPGGRLPSARWRPVAWCAAAYLGLWTVAALLAPAPPDDRFTSVHNPFGVRAVSGLPDLAIALSLPLIAMCGAALIQRFRGARGQERQQLKWLAYGTALPAILIGLVLASGNGGLPWQQTVVIIPVAVGIAILRYRLYDIDLLINRTLVYGALTACVVGLYVVVVGAFGSLLQVHGSPIVAFLATGLVAVLFQPLRATLQRGVNRMMYGRRDDPYAVISALARRLEGTMSPWAILPGVAETVRDALKLPYVGIALEQDGARTVAAASGTPGDRLLTLPLVHQHRTVGQLLLAPRRGDDDLTPADHRLLGDLARQAGAAAHAVRLATELQQARGRLVAAREEERRRLRRDLHDGLGPQLASQTLTLTAVRKLLRHDPEGAERLLDDAMAHAEEAINDIRRLVYALRPPALDDLGLLGSLREGAARSSRNGLRVAVEGPPAVSTLPAAVEVACYRIAQEALTNVVRHAHARTCTIRLRIGGAVCLEIIDDGVGLAPEYRAGIGLQSMRERAEELGGSCLVEPHPGGGTAVRVHLPLPEGA